MSKTVNNCQISLKMIDSVGFGDSMELKSWYKYIEKYIKGNVSFTNYII